MFTANQPTVDPSNTNQNQTLARVLFVGDVVGPLGLATIETLVPELRRKHGVDFCVANGENSVAGGAGIDHASAARLFAAGVDVITTGNHAHDTPGADELLGSGAPIVRPSNLPGPGDGRARVVVERDGIRLGVVNVIGANDGLAPVGAHEEALTAVDALADRADLVLVDVHASWPAEKLTLAWMLDGRVCGVFGTHTHVPTADARLLPRGTAYISDVGMTGAVDSLIGYEPEDMVRELEGNGAARPAPATSGEGVLMGVLVTAALDGRASAIEPIRAYSSGHEEPPAAVVFDCDGLLVDSASCWRQAYERVLGRQLDERMLADLNGASVAVAAAALGVTADALNTALHEAFATGPLQERPGARALLSRLDGRLPVAVASNAPHDLVALALRKIRLDAYLPVIISADGGPGKPAPDVYLDACAHLGVAPHRAVALEDSPVGAAAAQAAGLRLIYVPSAEPGPVSADVAADRLDDDAVLAALNIGPEPMDEQWQLTNGL